MNLSVVIIVRNEEMNIRRCLEAVRWCDDVLVVDDFSDDRTREIAVTLGARVLQNHFCTFASQRNWALDQGKLKHDWVLMLDADEVATEPLRCELEAVLPAASPDVVGFLMCRKTMFMDRWLRFSDGFPVWIMRLVRRNGVRFVDAGHGEEPVPAVTGKLGRIHEPFLHYPFSKGITDWVNRHNRYSTLEAELELNRSSDWAIRDVLSPNRATRRKALRNLSRTLPFRPIWRFCFHYIFKAGIFDGCAGWNYACLMSVYEALIVMKRREQELRVHLSSGDTVVHDSTPVAAPQSALPDKTAGLTR